jgi:cellulose synthase/poly-beta-1,6-N-acetylglucosamine synthase-like glycosyltransferase
MIALAYALGVLAALLLVPVSVLVVQVLFALRDPAAIERREIRRRRVAVLVPAHNEASVIAATLRSVMPELRSGDRILVVADNCSDDTAKVAALAGASVVERRDAQHRGKNYALEFGVQQLASDPPDIVTIVDADCQVETGAIDTLALACEAAGRPIQSLYLMLAPPGAGHGARVAEFAWIVKNWVRPLGMRRLGLPCQLMGTGTAFPWRAIAGFRIANEEMAEDYKFGVEMALAGYPAVFCPDARVRSDFPSKKAAEQTQRTRWEHGHLQLIMREAPRLMASALRRRDLQLFGLAIDLVVPPLAFLALVLAATVFAGLVLGPLTDVYWPLVVGAAGASLFAAAIGFAWLGWGRNSIPPRALLAMPAYVVSKIPLYVRFITRRQKVWIKTERD